MSAFYKLRMVAFFAAVLILAGAGAEAQGSFGLLVTSSASSILVSNSLTYTITVTNIGTLASSGTVTGGASILSSVSGRRRRGCWAAIQ